MDMEFKNKNIVFLGIGGISMSALARLCYSLGANIFGTDITDNENVQALKHDKIAKIKIGKAPLLVKNADLVIFTNAIPKNDSDLKLAYRLHKKVYERATLLGILSCKYNNLIAISGTHGKTTTTALLGWIFYQAKLAPTVHIGGIAKNFDSNLKLGSRNYFITEACEYQKSFLHLNPHTTIINNIEMDHPDCYKDKNEIQKAFLQLSRQTKDNLVINGDLLSKDGFNFKNTKTFGFDSSNDIYAKNIKSEQNITNFDIYAHGNKLGKIYTSLVGEHNIYNILSAVCVAIVYHIDFDTIKTAILSFEGTKRRFENIYHGAFDLILDYAHHPSEISACINSAKKLKHNRLIGIFQPHTYSRTLALMPEFSKCFLGLDILFVLPTYPAREQTIMGGRAIDLFYNIQNVKSTQYFTTPNSINYTLDNVLQNGDIVLWLGAGDIEKFAREYAKTLVNIK